MYLFTINKNSGNGRGTRVWRSVKRELELRHIPYTAIIMDGAVHAINLIENQLASLQQADTEEPVLKAIVVIGGDGTLHSLLPLLAVKDIPLGIIPSGSGNDTARAFNIPINPLVALNKLLTGNIISVDLIQTYFPDIPTGIATSSNKPDLTLTAVAAGFDSAIAAAVNRSTYKKWCNRLGISSFAYVIGVFQTLLNYRPIPIEVTVDDQLHRFERGWLVAVANGASYGGGLRICPDADPSDRLLDICVVHSCSPLQLLRLLPTLLTGAHTKLRFLTMIRGTSIHIAPTLSKQSLSERSFTVYGDGEELGTSPYQAVIRPAAIKLIL